MLCWTQPALADCASPPCGGDEALIARVNPASVAAHQALYNGEKVQDAGRFRLG